MIKFIMKYVHTTILLKNNDCNLNGKNFVKESNLNELYNQKTNQKKVKYQFFLELFLIFYHNHQGYQSKMKSSFQY